jgi:hypothetical protein
VALPNGKYVVVAKTSLGTNVVVAQMSFLFRGGTNVGFLGISGTYVDLVEGGKNVVVAVAKTAQRKNVGGKKVAASVCVCVSGGLPPDPPIL